MVATCFWQCIRARIRHAHVEFLIPEELTQYATVEAEVRSSSMSVVYVVRLRIVFSKAALQRWFPWNPWNPLWIRHWSCM